VKLAGSASDADVSSLATDPEVQVTPTPTLAALLSVKSLLTTTWAVRRVFTIVQVPAESSAEHVPVDEYPIGIGDSVAVHVGSPLKPLTVNEAGVLSDADVDDGITFAGPQTKVTVTLAALFGTKSFCTVKLVLLSVLTMVQVPNERGRWHIPADE
jgi:hypothetical protein